MTCYHQIPVSCIDVCEGRSLCITIPCIFHKSRFTYSVLNKVLNNTTKWASTDRLGVSLCLLRSTETMSLNASAEWPNVMDVKRTRH